MRGRAPQLGRPHWHDGFVRHDRPSGVDDYDPAGTFVGEAWVDWAGGGPLDDYDPAGFVVRVIKLVGPDWGIG